jgi:hypothetical protein
VDVVALEDLPGAGGYTPALRQLGRLADGSTVFVKTPTTEVTRRMLVDEIAAYDAIGPRSFCPRVLDASPERLVLEDLRGAHWPPPWRPGDVELVLSTMREVAALRVPELPAFHDVDQWVDVDIDAVAALGFDRTDIARLHAAGRAIESTTSLAGDALVHGDLRGDNLCLLDDGRVVLVDWNGACRGQEGADVTFWAPSLALEGGPDPWDLLPDAAVHHVAYLTGFFAARAP